MGTASGIVQTINNKFTLIKTQNYIVTILFFLFVGGIVFIAERTGLGDKRVNKIIGLLLIGIGIVIDLITGSSGII
jgi:uncharacterized ion transporter superfamily protein YfcC